MKYAHPSQLARHVPAGMLPFSKDRYTFRGGEVIMSKLCGASFAAFCGKYHHPAEPVYNLPSQT